MTHEIIIDKKAPSERDICTKFMMYPSKAMMGLFYALKAQFKSAEEECGRLVEFVLVKVGVKYGE